MREAIGSSLLLNIVIIFASIIILVFIGTLAYSKAYRVKNRIVTILNKYEKWGYDAKQEVDSSLKESGYNISRGNNCPTKSNLTLVNEVSDGYNYCIYAHNLTNGTWYYTVVTFTHFDIPVIGGFLQFPVSGETKIYGKTYNY